MRASWSRVCVRAKSLQGCQTLCDPMNCSPPGSFVLGDSPGKNTGAGCHALLQGIFPTQSSNPGLPHCKQMLYCLSHGKPKNTRVGCHALLQGIFLIQGWNLHLMFPASAGRFFTTSATWETQLVFDFGTSLMVPWLRTCLLMQGKWVQPLLWELRSHVPQDNLARAPKLLKSTALEPKKSHCNENPT